MPEPTRRTDDEEEEAGNILAVMTKEELVEFTVTHSQFRGCLGLDPDGGDVMPLLVAALRRRGIARIPRDPDAGRQN